MGVHIALGFLESGRRGEPVVLFVGQDAVRAVKAFEHPPEGVMRTELMSHVRHTRQREHDGSGAGYEGIGLPQKLLAVAVRDDASVEEVAGVLYEAYCEAVGGKNFLGDPLPSWTEFRADEKKRTQSDAWVTVAGLHPSEPDEVKAAADAAAATKRIELLVGEVAGLKREQEKLDELERGICPEGMGFVQFVEALKVESAERQVLLEAANGRIKELEGENAKLLEEIKALKSGTGVSHLLTEDPPAAEAPAEPEKPEGDTLKLNLPPKGGKSDKK